MTESERITNLIEQRCEFLCLADGYVYWSPTKSQVGCLGSYELRIIADELDKRNAEWDAKVKAELGEMERASESQ